MLIPFVIDRTSGVERSYDIYSRLLKDRIVFIGSEIDDDTANSVIAQLLYLKSENAAEDIHLYLNTPGGSVTAGLAVYDTMQFLGCPVATYCIGQASSMGAVILAGGARGKRYVLPHARVMIHQPWGGFRGDASGFSIHAREMTRVRESVNRILSFHTGKTLAKIARDTDRDFFMSAREAVSYGLCDIVLPGAAAATGSGPVS